MIIALSRTLAGAFLICSLLAVSCSPVRQTIHDDASFDAVGPDEADVVLTDGSSRRVYAPRLSADSVVWRGHGVLKTQVAKVTYRKPTYGNAFAGALGGMAVGGGIGALIGSGSMTGEDVGLGATIGLVAGGVPGGVIGLIIGIVYTPVVDYVPATDSAAAKGAQP